MRKGLKGILGERVRVKAKVSQFGTKPAWNSNVPLETVLLVDVSMEERHVADHVWLNRTKQFDRSGAVIGDYIVFDARVKLYKKGYRGRKAWTTGQEWSATDYGLSHPTRFRVLKW